MIAAVDTNRKVSIGLLEAQIQKNKTRVRVFENQEAFDESKTFNRRRTACRN